MDEATSNLDAVSEAQVLQALQRLAAGRTTFIIAHRLSVARQADLIVVLQAGKIVRTGHPRGTACRRRRLLRVVAAADGGAAGGSE